MKPDFICIGAHKSGTTWLYHNLRKHPEFWLPPVKELHYFDRSKVYPSPNKLSQTFLMQRLKDKQWRDKAIMQVRRALRQRDLIRARWYARYHFRNYSDRWYRSLFRGASGITGDITPSYSILNEEDIQRMQEIAPKAKLIFLLRNPIDRAWSMMRGLIKHNRMLDLEDFAAFKDRIDSPAQALRSDYCRTIDLFSKYYPSSQFLIGFFDAIVRDPKGLLEAIYEHLGVEEYIFPDGFTLKINASKPVECPEEFRDYLVQKYSEPIKILAARYGSYASEWHQLLNGEKAEQANGANRLSPVTHP